LIASSGISGGPEKISAPPAAIADMVLQNVDENQRSSFPFCQRAGEQNAKRSGHHAGDLLRCRTPRFVGSFRRARGPGLTDAAAVTDHRVAGAFVARVTAP